MAFNELQTLSTMRKFLLLLTCLTIVLMSCDDGVHSVKSEDGSTYVGELKDGMKHGQGTMTLTDGAKEVGEWKDNKLIK